MITFRDWLNETIADEEADEEYRRDLERHEHDQLINRRDRMLGALETFFPELRRVLFDAYLCRHRSEINISDY